MSSTQWQLKLALLKCIITFSLTTCASNDGWFSFQSFLDWTLHLLESLPPI